MGMVLGGPVVAGKCELCKREIDQYGRGQKLKGLCHRCSGSLGGGKFSCRAVQQERKAMGKAA